MFFKGQAKKSRLGGGFLRGTSPHPRRVVIGRGVRRCPRFSDEPLGLLTELCQAYLGRFWKIRASCSRSPWPGPPYSALSDWAHPLTPTSLPSPPPPISSRCLHLSGAYVELHCPLKLMTFSSQKEVVCGVILGVWVREKPSALVTFPPPHSFWGDTDHSFRGRSENLLAQIGNPKGFPLSSLALPVPGLSYAQI